MIGAGLILSAALLVAPAPAVTAAGDWTSIGPPAASERVIEVVDRIGPKSWKIAAAVRRLDGYTGSRMRVVKACSTGQRKAHRCITIRTGKVKGANVGWSKGSTITIDVRKAATAKYRGWYGKAAVRHWLLVHELGHQFGLKHSTGLNVMSPYVNRHRMTFTNSQRAHLKGR